MLGEEQSKLATQAVAEAVLKAWQSGYEKGKLDTIKELEKEKRYEKANNNSHHSTSAGTSQ